jgi:UDP-N-acetylmuramoylalanine--D-glutamate ligase
MADGLKQGRALVMGLGLFGGGLGVTKWLAGQGWRVVVTDTKSAADLAEPIADLQPLIDRGDVELRLGEHREDDFASVDLVVANVAVPRPWENRYLAAARAAGVRVTTEMGLLIQRLPAGAITIGVTGSVGKSTTSAMIAHVLSAAVSQGAAGTKVFFGGNIGVSLLPELERIGAGDLVVLELSSAMLHWLEGWSPRVAVATTFAANHIDWHGSIEHYRASKQAILKSQRPGDVAVVGSDAAEWPIAAGVERRLVERAERVTGLAIPGVHNEQNAAVAVAAALLAARKSPALSSLTPEVAQRLVRSFPGLPDRLQFVGSVRLPSGGEAKCFNDSKSTTPESAMLAIEAFAVEPGVGKVHLIVGGYDKGSDFGAFAKASAGLAGLYTIGKTGPAIAEAARRAGAKVVECGELSKAVDAAWGRMAGGDVLLLSPACASWDQFVNYQQRGASFVQLVRGKGGAA